MERNKYSLWLLMGFLLPAISFAQKKKKDDFTFLRLSDVIVDGDLTEWEGKFFEPDNELWSCALSFADNKVYAAVKVNDKMLQHEALRGGIILNLSYDSKKKEGARLIFPIADRESLRALNQDEDRNKENSKQDILNSLRGYYLQGFTRVVDGLLSFDNDYGIQAVAKLDTEDNLIYEAVIPLELIKFKSEVIAAQLAVNTQFMQLKKLSGQRRSSSMGPYGMYRTQEPTMRSPYKEKTEIWVTGTIK